MYERIRPRVCYLYVGLDGSSQRHTDRTQHTDLFFRHHAAPASLPPKPTEVLSATSPSFDISLLEILLPLGSGGTVILASREQARDGRLLRAMIESEHPTLIQATPVTWRMLLTAGWRGHDGLTLLTGGEVITPDLARTIVSRSSPR